MLPTFSVISQLLKEDSCQKGAFHYVCISSLEKVFRIPLSHLSNIWLQMDSLDLQVKCVVNPPGAADVHIILTPRGLLLGTQLKPYRLVQRGTNCCISFYTTSSPVHLPSVAD